MDGSGHGRLGADPDADDVRRASCGDIDAFRRLYEQHVDAILSLARRMLGPELAEDATQETFANAWRKLGQFRGDSQFGTWLFRIAINILVRQRRYAQRLEAQTVPLDLQMGSPSEDRTTRMDIDAALSQLPAGVREVIVLHDMEGFTHEEIALVLAVSVSASKMRLHRGRTFLRRFLA